MGPMGLGQGDDLTLVNRQNNGGGAQSFATFKSIYNDNGQSKAGCPFYYPLFQDVEFFVWVLS